MFMGMKRKQLEEAVEWCQVNKKCGWAAINLGKFPLIKDLPTIKTGKEKEYCPSFTKEEEESLVCLLHKEQKQAIN